MKRWLSLAAVVLLCLALVVGVACGEGEEEEEGVTEIKLGVGVPLTGVYGAVLGIPAKKGFEFLADRIGVFEMGGKQYRWKIIVEDTAGATAAGAVAATTKLIYDHDVDFVHITGGGALAAQTLCEEAGVILDMGTSTFEGYGPDKTHSIQTAANIQVTVAAFYDWLAREHPEVKHIVVTAVDHPVSAAYNEAYESNMHEYFGFERDIVWVPAGITEYYPVATSVMELDPDLVIVSASTAIMDIVWELGYEGLGVAQAPIPGHGILESWGWSDCKGFLLPFTQTYGAEEVWPEAVAFARDYEAHYDEEMGNLTFWGAMVLEVLHGVIQKAGVVDTDEILGVIHGKMCVDTMLGPVCFSGEEFVGINCIATWPVCIFEVVGEREYEPVAYYTAEEAEAIGVEAWKATMP